MAIDTYITNVIHFSHSNDTDTLYGVVRNVSKQVRDVANGEWDSHPASGSLDDYDISAAVASGGLWSGNFPEIANGFCIYQIRNKAGGTPDFDDEIIGTVKGYWNGEVFAAISLDANGRLDVGKLAGSSDSLDRLVTSTKVIVNKAVQDKTTGAIDYYEDDEIAVALTHTPADGESTITRIPG